MHYPVPSQQIHRVNRFASRSLREEELFPLGIDALRSHAWVLGAPGVGKTAAIASALVWLYFYHGWPCIILDPVGALSRWLVWHIGHRPRYLQPPLFDRLVYVARGASDYVVPTPLYDAKSKKESLYATASRLIDVIARVDPFLATASIEGMNALREAGIYGGQLAAAMGLQITDVADMLRRPDRWVARVTPLAKQRPELQPALEYLFQLKEASPSIRARKTGSFMNKLIPFLSDPVMQAPYAASGPGLKLDAHVAAGDTVVFDYSHLLDRDHRQFAMLWDFLDILEWAKGRGIEGRETPCLLCIDEVSAMTNLHAMEYSVLGDDIAELATQWARNIGVQLCFMNQTVSQLPPPIVTALSQFGTKIVGNIPNIDDALYLARLVHDYDPHLVRKTENMWVNDPDPEYHWTGGMSASIFARSNFRVIDTRTTEYTIDEQYLMAAQVLQKLPKFHFIVKAALGEGNLTGAARKVSFEHLINGHFPDSALLGDAMAQLRAKWGVPVDQVLNEIRQRKQQPAVKAKKRKRNRRKKRHDRLETSRQTTVAPSAETTQDHEQQNRPSTEPESPGAPAWKQTLWASQKGNDDVPQE